MQKFEHGRDFDWDDLGQLLRYTIVVNRERITADCVRGFGFLADLSEHERVLAVDQYQREHGLAERLRDGVEWSKDRMKISERTIKRLGEIITGDKSVSPYRSGPNLVDFFNEFGTNHTYGQGFPSRWSFAQDCIRHFNGTPTLKKIILAALDPRDFVEAMVFDRSTQERKPANLQEAVTYLNEFLAFDGYEIVPHGKGYDVIDKMRGEIIVDVKLEPSHLSHAFIATNHRRFYEARSNT